MADEKEKKVAPNDPNAPIITVRLVPQDGTVRSQENIITKKYNSLL